MKKPLIISCFVLAFGLLNAQDKESFKIEKESINYLVIDMPDKSQKQLYESVIKYIKKTYNSPDDVILSEIENEYIRFQGYKNQTACYTYTGFKTCFDLDYSFELAFKDNKYKISVIKLKPINDKRHPGFPGYKSWFKKNGDKRPAYTSCIKDAEDFLNNVSDQIIASIKKEEQEEDW